MSITIKKIRSLLSLLESVDSINVSEVSIQTGISRRTIDRKVKQINSCGKSIGELLALTDHELEKVFASKPRRERCFGMCSSTVPARPPSSSDTA